MRTQACYSQLTLHEHTLEEGVHALSPSVMKSWVVTENPQATDSVRNSKQMPAVTASAHLLIVMK
jgi:hypothetical protein